MDLVRYPSSSGPGKDLSHIFIQRWVLRNLLDIQAIRRTSSLIKPPEEEARDLRTSRSSGISQAALICMTFPDDGAGVSGIEAVSDMPIWMHGQLSGFCKDFYYGQCRECHQTLGHCLLFAKLYQKEGSTVLSG